MPLYGHSTLEKWFPYLTCLDTARQLGEESEVESLTSFLSSLHTESRHLLDHNGVCAFCKDTDTNPVVFAYSHVFCFGCVNRLIEHLEHFEHCPLCQRRLFCSDPVGRHLRTLSIAVMALAYAFLHIIGRKHEIMRRLIRPANINVVCYIFGSGYAVYTRLAALM